MSADIATAIRQPSDSASTGISAAPSAPPNGKPTCLKPTIVARCRKGNHPITALVDVGFSIP
jgi:hypothetical protein